MEEVKENTESENKLSFRLPRGISTADKETEIYLIRKNPLSTITLNLFWKPAIDILSKGEFISFEKICFLVDADSDKIEIYLNSLVRKGFMESRGYRNPETLPYITIIVPVRNRPDGISDCLTSLVNLDYPPEKKEIIVIDDASDDNTPDVISTFPVKLIKNSKRMNASYSRNIAAEEAKGDLLAFIDSDCTADSMWLKELVSGFVDNTNGAVGGKVDSPFMDKALDRYEKVSSSLNMGNRSRSSKEEGGFFYLPTCNLLVKKEQFLRLGGFNAEMTVGEDVDFCWRLKNSGFEIGYRPFGVVFHKHRNKTGAFFIRRLQYGTSEPFLQKKHSDRLKEMFFPVMTSIFWGLLLLTVITGFYYLMPLCIVPLFIDTNSKWKQVRDKKLPISYIQIFSAVFRGCFITLYYLAAFFSRYYLVFAFLLFPFFPVLCLILFIDHFIISFCEFFIKKPPLNIFSFIYFFTLDQLAYQAGVWYGCFRHLTFNPVNPKISRYISS